MTMIQIAGAGVVGTLLALQFKNGKNEYGIYLSIAISLLLFYGMKDHLAIIAETVSMIGTTVKLEAGYLTALLKMLGVVYLAEFASAICRDAGNQTIAGQIEVFAKLMILALSMPILEALLLTIREFWQ